MRSESVKIIKALLMEGDKNVKLIFCNFVDCNTSFSTQGVHFKAFSPVREMKLSILNCLDNSCQRVALRVASLRLVILPGDSVSFHGLRRTGYATYMKISSRQGNKAIKAYG